MKALRMTATVALASLLCVTPASAQTVFNEVEYSPRETVFHLNAPKQPTLRLYKTDRGKTRIKKLKMQPDGANRWKAVVDGNLKGRFYTFDIGRGETPGVFAKAVGMNGQRGAVVDLNDTNPVGWQQDHRLETKLPSDLVIYELHHRDFSVSPTSGLVNKGKYLALAELKATRYLDSLGVNAVHLLPSFDYGSVDESRPYFPQYNWGYDPVNYNVPEGSYSYDPSLPTRRIMEFKRMVQALHQAGIRVILDVVYNHTYNIDRSNFTLTFPGAYYRYDSKGKPSNGSGCGNETASEKPLMREFMLESVKYWAEEYHIDGFRFDLMGVHDIETMRQIERELHQIDPSIFIYGEGWSAGQCALPTERLAMKANMRQLPGIAAFCDDIRDALRGPFSDDTKGAFLAGIAGSEESLKAGLAGMVAHPQVDYTKVNYSSEPWATEPTQMIAYVSCHDDMCLTDRLRASVRGITTDELIRLDLLAQTAVMLSQGVPFMLSGEEMLRTKHGVHNSFESPDSINAIDWSNLQRYPQVFNYYRNLISLRRNHPAFRLGSAEKVRQSLEFLPGGDCLVAFRLKNNAGGDSWRNIIVVLNANKKTCEVSIPDGEYTVVGKDGVINERGLGTVRGNKAVVDAQSALILHD